LPVQAEAAVNDALAMARWAIENPDCTVDLIPGRHPSSAEVTSTGENPARTAILPGFTPAALGDPSFLATHNVRFPYICGEMANGIASVPMVIAMAKVGMLGFFGAAGLPLTEIERAIAALKQGCGSASWGSNLIHSPQDPELEERSVDLYLREGVTRVSASAFMALRPSIVRYAYSGITTGPDGTIIRRNHVFAKISRVEVAKQFLAPAPDAMLAALGEKGLLTPAEIELARRLPVAEDFTVEADSGGHTDNRALTVLLPSILHLRDEMTRKHGWTRPIRIGAAGGIGTPGAAAAAFAMGAAYVLTGSINQSAIESALSPAGKKLLTQAAATDVMMAPAADMFELGVKVQVLKRASFFAARASKLYELYIRHDSLEQIPADTMKTLERDVFKQPVAQVWADTEKFFKVRMPHEMERAARDPKHRMALVFRWYLHFSSRWAISGEPTRQVDYQIWCGPAMGVFNQWVAGTFLEKAENRTVAQIALNLMHGAASISRAQQLRTLGVAVPAELFNYIPRPLDESYAL
jgi:trans-AT polyketide synthase/acyltransferase/oxidoreductase domain-containing protein